jgi:hypothetical protein
MSKSIKQQTIESYNKKIKWMEKQPLREKPDYKKMYKTIGIGIGAMSCPYCHKYLQMHYCFNCKLNPTEKGLWEESSEIYCCNGLWLKMKKARTYKTAIKYAKLVRQYIIDNG